MLPLQVIIVPIFWNKRVHEKEEVLEAAQWACDLLTGSGITAGCDTTLEMSPGQKFKHWCQRLRRASGLAMCRIHRTLSPCGNESRTLPARQGCERMQPARHRLSRPSRSDEDCREQAGVKVRLELGPKEAAAGQCILAICTTPGEVAAKTTLQVWCLCRTAAVLRSF